MLDIKLIRQDAGAVQKAMQSRGLAVDIAAIADADTRHRAALQELEAARAQQNMASKGPMDPASIDELKALKGHIKELQVVSDALELQVSDAIAPLPNIPLADTPVGTDASANVEISVFGDKPVFAFTPKHYMDIAEAMGTIDTESAATVAGTRFGYIKGAAAQLQFALLQYALSRLTDVNWIESLITKYSLPLKASAFTFVIPPVMLRPEMMRAMGFAERAGVEPGNDEIYFLERDGLYLAGTSEQPLGAMHYDRMLNANELPLRYVGYSTCFRREAGAAGKDTRGILRVHQFDKMEMFTVCEPGHSAHEHRLILAIEEELMRGLGLHYRVVRLCTGDIGAASAATYDIETWMPGQNEYRETHSCSNTTDFQSRALKTRFKAGDTAAEFPHMLNGTVFSQRPIIAILEQFQNEDGTVRVPEVLQSYMGGLEIIRSS